MRFRADSHYDKVQLRINEQVYEMSPEKAERLAEHLKISKSQAEAWGNAETVGDTE